ECGGLALGDEAPEQLSISALGLPVAQRDVPQPPDDSVNVSCGHASPRAPPARCLSLLPTTGRMLLRFFIVINSRASEHHNPLDPPWIAGHNSWQPGLRAEPSFRGLPPCAWSSPQSSPCCSSARRRLRKPRAKRPTSFGSPARTSARTWAVTAT